MRNLEKLMTLEEKIKPHKNSININFINIEKAIIFVSSNKFEVRQ